jgi:hypothetical protein
MNSPEETITAEGPLTPSEADAAYRRLRLALLLALLAMLIVAGVMAVIDVTGWQVYLIAIVVIEGISLPIILRVFRRQLDRKVRLGIETLE